MRRVRSLFVVALLLCSLVSGAAIAPAMAQSDGDGIDITVGDGEDSDEEDEEDSDDGDGDEEDDEQEGLLGGPDDVEGTTGIGSGFGSSGGGNTDRNSAGGFLDGTSEWMEEGATSVIPVIVDGTLQVATGAPTMDNSGWLGVFGTPTADPHATLFAEIHESLIFPLTLTFLAAAILLTGTVLPFGGLIGRYNASRWVLMTFALILALSLSWPLVSAMHALSDTIGAILAPSSDELLGSEQGLRTLGAASIPGAVGFYVFGWAAAVIYGLIFGMRYFFLMMVFPYVFPVALTAALAAPWRKLRSFGSSILWLHVGLLIVGWPVALFWRAAYAIDFQFGLSGFGNLLMIIGSIVAGIVITVFIMRQMTQLTGVVRGAVLGAGASLAARSSYVPKSVNKAKQVGSRARDIGRSASSRARTMSEATNGGVATDGGRLSTRPTSQMDLAMRKRQRTTGRSRMQSQTNAGTLASERTKHTNQRSARTEARRETRRIIGKLGLAERLTRVEQRQRGRR